MKRLLTVLALTFCVVLTFTLRSNAQTDYSGMAQEKFEQSKFFRQKQNLQPILHDTVLLQVERDASCCKHSLPR